MRLSKPSLLRQLSAIALATGCLATSALAVEYSYTPNNTPSAWSSGTGWSAIPVGATDTSLVFGPTGAFAGLIIDTNTNDLGNFQLNKMTLQGQSDFATTQTITIASAVSTLDFINNGATAPTVHLDATGGTFFVNYNVSAAINLSNTTTFSGEGDAGFNFSGPISGTGGIIKSGSSTVTLSGANTFSGATTLSGGIVKISGANNLGDGSATNTLHFNGGTLESTAGTYDLGATHAVVLDTDANIQVDAGSTLNISGSISGSGGINKPYSNGNLGLLGNNSYSGPTNVTGGTLQINNANSLGNNAVTNVLNLSGTLQSVSGTYSLGSNQNITLASASIFLANAGSDLTIPGTIDNQSFQLMTFGSAAATGNLTVSGVISSGGGGLTKSGNGTLTLNGLNTFNGNVTINNSGTVVIGTTGNASAGAFGVGTNLVTVNNPGTAGVTLQGTGAAPAVSNMIVFAGGTDLTLNVSGSSNLTFNGKWSDTSGGANFFTFNAPKTTLAGGLDIAYTTAGNRTWNFFGASNVEVSGPIAPGASTGTATLDYNGSGNLILSAANGGSVVGSTAGGTLLVQVGTNSVNGSHVLGPAVTATLKIAGNYTIGSAGVASLVIRGGDPAAITTPTSRGVLSLVDGGINTLSINSTTAGATVLTMADAGVLSSNLNMEIAGNGLSDTITLGAGLKVKINAGKVNLNITSLGGFTSGAATQSFTLLTAPGAGLTAGGGQFNFVPATATSGNFGGYTTAVLTSTTTTTLILTLGGLTPTPGTAYWTGAQGIAGSGSWNTLTGGTANNSNWSLTADGLNVAHQVPGATSDVFFSGATATSSPITASLGADTSIKSLHFTNVGGAVTVGGGGGNTLTVGTGGITVDSGAAAPIINSPVVLGVAQSWTNNSANDLTANGAVSGAFALTKAGTGALVLGGSNTFTGGLVINDGAVRVANAGALNSTTPQTVTFGPSAPSTAKLQTNGNSITIGGLATDATPGTPIVENANATPATLSVSQATNTTYAGVIQDGTGGGALSFVKRGTGTLSLTGANTYTGTTIVGNGRLLVNGSIGSGAVSVAANADNRSAVLGGTGTINGAVTVTTPTGSGRSNVITGGDIGTTGTLALASGLTMNSGSIAYFDINDNSTYDSIHVTGNLTLLTGMIIQVPPSLTTSTSYDLFTYTGTGPASLSGINFQNFSGGTLPGNYGFSIVGSNTIRLTITNATTAIPTINITSPADGLRVMKSSSVSIGGNIGNTGVASMNATLGDNGGQLTLSNFSPSGATPVGAGGTQPYTADVANTGTTLGIRTYSIKVDAPGASPSSTSASSTLDVLDNRTVDASTVAFGPVHVNATANGTTSMTSTQPDDQYTRVTVANGTTGAFSVSGGTNPTFDGSTSDSRTVSGAFNVVGANQIGTVTLITTGEAGVTGTQTPINVSVGYGSTSVYSGKAAWNNNSATASWDVDANWSDTDVLNTGGLGTPGVDGAASIGDTATFGDVSGLGSTATVSLNGASPTLAAINFTSPATAYTIATGTSGTITLQSGNAINVSASALTPTISAVLTGANGLNKTGPGTLVLSGSNTYTGGTSIANGAIQIATGDDRLPTGTTVTLGSGTLSGKLILGQAGARNQTLAGLQTSGSGVSNAVVGGAGAISTLTANIGSGVVDTFSGLLGGGTGNENNLALTKTGLGTLILSNAPTYVGTTTVNGGILQAPGISASSTLTLVGGSAALPAIFQSSGTFTRAVGTSTTNAPAGGLNWGNFSGFSAIGAPLVITATGNSLTWSVNFVNQGTNQLFFGSTTSNAQVELTNNVVLGGAGTTSGTQRAIYVEQGVGGDSAKLSGILSDSVVGGQGLSKLGNGTLILSGANTYSGPVTIGAGLLQMVNPTALGGSALNVPLGTNATTTIATGATLDLNGQPGIIEPIIVNGGGIGSNGALINSNTGATASIDGGVLVSIGIGGAGAGYTTATVDITGGGGTGATATATVGTTGTNVGKIIAITLTNAGTGYTSKPTITINGDGLGATAASAVSSVTLNSPTENRIGGAGDITVNAIISGGINPMTKVGNGKLTLTAANAYSGTTTVNAGTLQLENSAALGTGSAVINAGTTTILGQSQTLTLNIASLTWTGGSMNYNLAADGSSDLISMFGLFSKGAGSASLNFDFGGTGIVGQVYTLISYTSTDFADASQFTYSGLGDGTVGGQFAIDGTHLTFTPIPEPGVVVLLIVGLGLVVFRQRKRPAAARE